MESHAAELTRAISELSLQSMVPRAVSQEARVYSPAELLRLRPAINEHEEHNASEQIATVDSGVATPAEFPRGPPPTPEANSKSETATTKDTSQPSPLNPKHDAQAPVEAESSINGLKGHQQEQEGLEITPKKKKKKSSGKNKKPAPTGFEEFYADPPIAPGEFEEESEVYGEGRPFHARMQACIQRYRARRKLDEFRSKVFTKYLMLGGVEASSTKQFNGGLDEDTLQNSTAADIAAIQATDYIRGGGSSKYYEPGDADGWTVDFEGVAKGFFSYRVIRIFPLDKQEEIQAICNTIRNFLNYVLTHAVCPEYTLDVLNARKICDRAEKELWDIKKVNMMIPGKFNVAASTLFGDSAGLFLVIDDMEMDMFPSTRMLTREEAEMVFMVSLAIAGSEQLYLKALEDNVHVVKTELKALEVIEIVRPSQAKINQWAVVKDHRGVAGGVQPLGIIKFKAWEGPGLDEEDMTDDEGELEVDNTVTETLWLEDEALQNCFIGMKIELKISELNIGVKFIEGVAGIYCSFFTYLPQEKMVHWKDPVPNPRPAPTEDDPDSEDQAMYAMGDDDFK